jgi:hypothetical protein
VVLKLFPDYASIQDEVHVRITDLPIQDKLRDLREVRDIIIYCYTSFSISSVVCVTVNMHYHKV